jgi:hypothetical protein
LESGAAFALGAGRPFAFGEACVDGLALLLDLDFSAMGTVRNREELGKIQLNFRKVGPAPELKGKKPFNSLIYWNFWANSLHSRKRV